MLRRDELIIKMWLQAHQHRAHLPPVHRAGLAAVVHLQQCVPGQRAARHPGGIWGSAGKLITASASSPVPHDGIGRAVLAAGALHTMVLDRVLCCIAMGLTGTICQQSMV